MRHKPWLVVALAASLGIGCSGSGIDASTQLPVSTGGSGGSGGGTAGGSGGSTSTDASPLCVPGQSSACFGPGACPGGQVCSADGRGFGSCVCGTTGGAGTDATAPADAAVDVLGEVSVDAKSDTPDERLDPGAGCAVKAVNSKPIGVDVLLLLDTSGSMDCPTTDATCANAPPGGTNTRLQAVATAVQNLVNAPTSANIGVGLTSFPKGPDQCTADYTQLTVPIAPAGTNASAIQTTIGALTPALNTPTEQALTGAYKAATAYMANTPGHAVAVILVTDGMPYACMNDRTGAVAASLAQAAFIATPAIKTYVVGLGNTATLDAIAMAGSGGATHYIPANSNVTQQLLTLLDSVSSAITCDYALPTGQALDYSLVNVQTTPDATGSPTFVGGIANASQCGPKGGWYYDVYPAKGTPTNITLCPTSCDPIKATANSSLQVLIGCATEPPR